MKTDKTKLLILLSTVFLSALLAVQLYWLLSSARVKEEQFNQSVTMALCKTAEMMCADEESCASLESCCMVGDSANCTVVLEEDQKAKIDSLLQYYMEFYHVQLDYEYEIVKTSNRDQIKANKNIFGQKLEPGLPGEYQLRVHMPEKADFLRSELSGLFIATIVLILLLIALFYVTIRSLLHTNKVLLQTTDFVNNMTHEFRTPLSNISLANSRLKKDDLEPEKKSRYTSIIEEENKKLQTQIDRLLDFYKAGTTGINLNKENCNINDLVASTVESFESRIVELNGTLTLNKDPEAINLIIDQMHIRSALSTIIDNALKYSANQPEISVKVATTKHQVLIEVTDKGIGMDTKEMEMIFKPYYRVSQGDRHDVKGFGIGLSYASQVIKAHGGTISVSSKKSFGSTFTISLPMNNGR